MQAVECGRALCHVQGAAKDMKHFFSDQTCQSSAFLHLKTMEKQRSGIQNRILCEQPLIRGFKEACVWTKHVVYCQETQEYTKTVVRYCLETLQMWFDAIGFVDEVQSWCLHCKIVLINVEPVSNPSLSLSLSVTACPQPADLSFTSP